MALSGRCGIIYGAVIAGLMTGLASVATAAEIKSNFVPTKPVRIIVTASAGASSDMLSRTVARKLSEIWGRQVIVENIPGGSGNIGLEQVAKSRPDGHTIAVGGDKVPLNAVFYKDYKEIGYDPLKDLSVVTKAVASAQILVAKPALGVKTLADYLKLAKEKDGKLTVGLPGNGGLGHIAHALLAQSTSTKYTYIPYKGGAPAATDLLGGHIDSVIITMAAVTEHVRAGRLTALAVTSPTREKALPNVPTIAEAGVPGFGIESWQGFFVSSRTPGPVVDKLNADFVNALRSPDVREFLEGQGFRVVASSSADGNKTVADDYLRFKQIIKSANIQLEE